MTEEAFRGFFKDFDIEIQNALVDICGNPIKSNKFFINLSNRYGLSYEVVMEHFVYAGGNAPPNDNSDQYRHWSYHTMAYPKAPLIEDVTSCVCEHPIVNNCFIFDTRKVQTDKTAYINVGNCCIKRFMKNSGRTCMLCKEPHKNRKNNLCNSCREQGYNVCEECGEAELCKELCDGCVKQRCKDCKVSHKEIGHYCLTCSKKHCGTCDKLYRLDEREAWRKECKKCWWNKKHKCEHCRGSKMVKGEQCWFC